jgi:hypothetical protein
MCLICLEFDKNTMSVKEARRALGEMVAKVGTRHAREVEEKLDAAEAIAAASSPAPGGAPSP